MQKGKKKREKKGNTKQDSKNDRVETVIGQKVNSTVPGLPVKL